MPDRRWPASSGLRIVVSGMVGQYPLGGVTWDYLQYALGFALLGHDVYYLEDTGQWPYDPARQGLSDDPTLAGDYIGSVMHSFGMDDRWMYRFPRGPRWFGLPEHRRDEVLASADLLVNVSGSLRAPDEYRQAERLIYIDTDPVFTQIKLARGQTDFRKLVDAHDVHFTFGESIGRGQATGVPATGHRWIPTRQPVVLDQWCTSDDKPRRDVFTTVMNWTSYKPLDHEGRTFGQKDVEMERFIDLPSQVSPRLELAIAPGKGRGTPHARLRRSGWDLVDPSIACRDASRYRQYIRSSAAEWSVAKNGYVIGRSGWFSCRTACYLASGRPAVVQDTGFSDFLPTGEGLLAFDSIEGARDGIMSIHGDYDRHARTAREIAAAEFDSGTVLSRLIAAASSTNVEGPAIRVGQRDVVMA